MRRSRKKIAKKEKKLKTEKRNVKQVRKKAKSL